MRNHCFMRSPVEFRRIPSVCVYHSSRQLFEKNGVFYGNAPARLRALLFPSHLPSL
jgi:hypothetical protein